jgi:hypothetical protein
MRTTEFKMGRCLLVRLKHGSEVNAEVLEIAKDNKIHTATFTLIGALKRAKIAYYNQAKKEYKLMELQGPHEISSCTGNVSLHEDKPFVHAHVVLADEHGSTKSGHLLDGIVFAAELHLQELIGSKLERKHDEATGLALWKSGGK